MSRLFAAIQSWFLHRVIAFSAVSYLAPLENLAAREGKPTLGVERLTQYLLVDQPTDVLRALLAAYGVQVEPASFTQFESSPNAAESADQVTDAVAQACVTARTSGRQDRTLDPADILAAVSVVTPAREILQRLGLTTLQITYFLAHGCTLPASVEEEIQDLPDRPPQAWVRIKNDDYSTFNLLAQIMSEVFCLDPQCAAERIVQIHEQGAAFLGPFAYDAAREMVAKSTALARQADQPLVVALSAEDRLSADAAEREAAHTRLRAFAARQGRRPGFVRRHWTGERSLKSALWKVGLLGSGWLWFGSGLLLSRLLPHLSERSFVRLAQAVLVLTIPIFVWQWTGIWRAASRFTAQAPERHAGRLVQALMVSVVLGALGYGYQVRAQSPTRIPDYRITILDAQTLHFDGGLRRGATRDLRAVLDANPRIVAIRLQSPGGMLNEGLLMRNLIRDRNLVTHVSGVCASACTLAYLAGTRRYLSNGARLAFHRARVWWLPQTMESAAIDAALLRKQGIAQPFIDRIARTPATSAWVPAQDELLRSGVVHEIGEPNLVDASVR